MRRMRCAWGKVDEERFLGCRRLLLPDPTDRLLGKRLGEVPGRVVVRHLDRGGVLEKRREPLVRFAALEPVKVIEALSRRPTLVRTADAELVVGRVVPLAESGGRILIAAEDLRHAGGLLRPLAVVAG